MRLVPSRTTGSRELTLVLALTAALAATVPQADAGLYGRISDFNEEGYVDGWTAVGATLREWNHDLRVEFEEPSGAHHLIAPAKFEGDWRCRYQVDLYLHVGYQLRNLEVRLVVVGRDGQEASASRADWEDGADGWAIGLWDGTNGLQGADDLDALLEDVAELRIEFPGVSAIPEEDFPVHVYLDNVRVRVHHDVRLVTFQEPTERYLREFATLQEAIDTIGDVAYGRARTPTFRFAPGTHAVQGAWDDEGLRHVSFEPEGCSTEPTTLRPLTPGQPILDVRNADSLTIRELSFRDGLADVGGAIAARDVLHVTLVDGRYENNRAGAGGALFAEGAETVRTYRSTFVGNEATNAESAEVPHGGGAIAALRNDGSPILGRVELNGAVFTDNESASHGGALRARGFSELRASEGLECRENESAERGGALSVERSNRLRLGSSVASDSTLFEANMADFGGAVAIDGLESLEDDELSWVREVEFLANGAASDGGALHARGVTGEGRYWPQELHDNRFEGNTAGARGGALAIEDASFLLLRQNEYLSNQAFSGGAVFVTGSLESVGPSVRLEGESFGDPDDSIEFPLHRNVAQDRGGALLVEDARVDVNFWRDDEGVEHRSNFSHNQSANRGGAVAILGRGEVSISNTDFVENVSGLHGGAVSIEGEGAEVEDPEAQLVVALASNDYTGNLTQVGGGAVDAEGVADLFLGGTARENRALCEIPGSLGHGGAYSLREIGEVLVNGNLIDNVAAGDGGGLHASGVLDLRISAQEFRGNLARGGRAEGLPEDGRGGAVSLEDVAMGGIQVDMRENRAGWGGALHARNVGHAGLLELVRSSIEDNRGWRAGGGFRIEDSAGTWVESEYASQSGAFAVSIGAVDFRRNETSDWPAWSGWPEEPPGGGGAVSISMAAALHNQNRYLGNKAEYGGAVAVSGGLTNRFVAGAVGGISDDLIDGEPQDPDDLFERCFEDTPNGPGNEAFSHGGGLYALETRLELQDLQVTLDGGLVADCAMTVRNNSAGLIGGGIAIHGLHASGDELPAPGAHVLPEDSPCDAFPTASARTGRAALALHDATVQDNVASLAGGGLASLGHDPLAAYQGADSDRRGGAFVEVHGGEVSGNRVESSEPGRLGGGGGFYLSGHAFSGSLLDGVSVSANESNTRGAGLVAAAPADLLLTGSTLFAGNGGGATGAPALEGGGLYLTDGARLLVDGAPGAPVELRDNLATGAGGGVHLRSGARVHLRHAVVSGNQADDGGGLFAHEAATCTHEGTRLEGNRASGAGGGLRIESGAPVAPDPPWSVAGHAHLGLQGVQLTENAAGTQGGGASVRGRPESATTAVHVRVESGTSFDANTAGGSVSSAWFPLGLPASGLDLQEVDGAIELRGGEFVQHLDGAALTLRCDEAPGCAVFAPAVIEKVSFRLNEAGVRVLGRRAVHVRGAEFQSHGAAGLVLENEAADNLTCCSEFSDNALGVGLTQTAGELRGNLLADNATALEARFSTVGDGGLTCLVTGNEIRAPFGGGSRGVSAIFEGGWPTDPTALGSGWLVTGNDLTGFVGAGDFAYRVDLAPVFGPDNPAEACPPFLALGFALSAHANHWGCAAAPLGACDPRPEGDTCGRVTHFVDASPAAGAPTAADRSTTCLADPCTEFTP